MLRATSSARDRRRVTLEYVLIQGRNMGDEDADEIGGACAPAAVQGESDSLQSGPRTIRFSARPKRTSIAS